MSNKTSKQKQKDRKLGEERFNRLENSSYKSMHLAEFWHKNGATYEFRLKTFRRRVKNNFKFRIALTNKVDDESLGSSLSDLIN